ncbi:MAG TPA: DJ-1 family glyoxalase III [Polyangiaceae bacterium]|nr:DJ-1 family glyoxalase III [Polyangiaceae bacterium]
MSGAAPPRALVVLAPGAEEMEATITVDVLRRAKVEVLVAGLEGPGPVTCSRGVRLVPDLALADARGPFDLVALPGGAAGARALAASAELGRILREQEAQGRPIAAVCAAPIALAAHGVGRGRAMTCHPSVRDRVAPHARLAPGRVVEDGPFTTSQGPGTSFDFALALVRRLCGEAAAAEVRAPMMLDAEGA